MSSPDLISCHVLDTLTGNPAQGIKALLICMNVEGKPQTKNCFEGITNKDGRIVTWRATFGEDPQAIRDLLGPDLDGNAPTSVWKLKFNTQEYYGKGNTFWPEVEVNFFVKDRPHYHVPLLLGPYSFTTYRGS